MRENIRIVVVDASPIIAFSRIDRLFHHIRPLPFIRTCGTMAADTKDAYMSAGRGLNHVSVTK